MLTSGTEVPGDRVVKQRKGVAIVRYVQLPLLAHF